MRIRYVEHVYGVGYSMWRRVSMGIVGMSFYFLVVDINIATE